MQGIYSVLQEIWKPISILKRWSFSGSRESNFQSLSIQYNFLANIYLFKQQQKHYKKVSNMFRFNNKDNQIDINNVPIPITLAICK